MSIYVEINIHAPMDDLWAKTQVPGLHQRWDLRFTKIEYLPRENDSQPQKFLYSTRIGFGLHISGEGESVGSRDNMNGSRTSALKFWSDENYAFVDDFGRETITWIRRFHTKTPRRFDAYMIYSEQRKRIVDYLGTHQHLAVDIDLSVDKNGGLRLRSGVQRFYEGPIAFSFPLFFSGIAEVCEWYDQAIQKYRIAGKSFLTFCKGLFTFPHEKKLASIRRSAPKRKLLTTSICNALL